MVESTKATMVTEEIEVTASSAFLPDQSDPDSDRFIYRYTISIENKSDLSIQILARKWVIIDGNGKSTIVEGPGVVGETPVIDPGKHYQYSSYCPLATDFGTMEGTYQVIRNHTENMEISIPRFYLAANAL
jgi:ApaG protein